MSTVVDYLQVLASGVGVTVEVTVFGIALTIVASFLGGLGRLSDSSWVRFVAGAYIEVFRGTSALVQLFWIFYALPLAGIQLTPMVAGIVALGLNVGAYGAEVVRAGILAVPRGQVEAGIALNLSRLDRFRFIVLRQSLPLMIGPFTNLFISLLKGTALVSLITLADLAFRSQLLREQTGRSSLVLGLTLLIYLVLSVVITIVMRGATRLVSYPGSHNAGEGRT
jgi:polar amino acid transport system permease protein